MLNHVVMTVALCLLLSSSAAFGAAMRSAATNELTADQIVHRALARAQAASAANRQTNYIYEKITTTEELDGKGRVTHRKEKTVQFESGLGTLKQLKIDGEAASAREFKKEAESTADRQHLTKTRSSRRDDNWNEYLTKELVARYAFELIGREPVAGRNAYVLSFRPSSDKLPVKQMTDKLLNRLAGRVWIDVDEFEVAKAEIGLLSEVAMWGGMLGALRKFEFAVERARLDEHVWCGRVSNFEVEGRKLFDSTHLRVHSETGNFRKAMAFK